ncbi:MAG: hypothetical protein HY901_00905 [Deltaproteobacteria bacterium]|nr:hypothetical protein [Deltaproteobacteria bacterium]
MLKDAEIVAVIDAILESAMVFEMDALDRYVLEVWTEGAALSLLEQCFREAA